MSRLVRRPVTVNCAPTGRPVILQENDGEPALPVLAVVEHWREWIGALEGEPERDIWRVETPRGVCELHCLRQPTGAGEELDEAPGGDWLLYGWED